ncbi:MAG: tol-pal system protein YbgF [Salinicola sp.]|uniref:tol-pal system protein YbgF n=1 Tax=uncultured Salinicola sp. TaxID=1193542 RepID=UPI000C938F42|nr:tol-pal system protein YbgF [uncultured Salinicola sp.]MAM59771.1 tol-pal system protein YbgF [Salinicola sp.]
MKHGLKRLCGAGALVLPLSVWAQQPAIDDLTGQSNGFYSQTEARQSGGGTLTILNQLQDNKQQIQQLRGQVEELRYQLDQLKQQTQQQYLDLDDRISGGGANSGGAGDTSNDLNGSDVDSDTANAVSGGSASASAEGEAGSAAGSPTSSSATGDDGREAYQAAFQQVQSRQFGAAIDAFQRFIADYPQSSLLPNAHYWLGELYSAQSQLDQAAEAFDTVISDYPQSNKVPDALYKLGLLKARQGDTEGSRQLLQQVRSDYPDSNAAQMAGDFLNQMG